MSKASERDMETLLHSAAFLNPADKEALRGRLFHDMQALALDDLALAAGGLTEPFVPPEDRPDKEMRHMCSVPIC